MGYLTDAQRPDGVWYPGPDLRPVLWVWASHDSGGWHWSGEEDACKSSPIPAQGSGLVLLPGHPDRAGMVPAYCPWQQWFVLSLQIRIDNILRQQRAAKAALIADGCGDTHPRRVALFTAAKAATGALRALQGAMATLEHSRLRDCSNAYANAYGADPDWDADRRMSRAERAATIAREEAERASEAADAAVAAFEALL